MRRLLLALAVVAGALWLAPGALAAGWCGSGEASADRTDIVTGRQIHAVVVVPSDSADTFAVDAGKLADDVASLSAWWIGQDPTRVPRFDLADFGGTPCLDVSFVRLSQPAAFISNAQTAFRQVEFDLSQANLWSPYKRYLVYYDGPAPELDVCGVGGGSYDSGPALAVVLLAGCPGVPTDTIATHELLHALGAVPPGDPHACPNDPGHPCDSPTDILYPYTRGEPLAQKVLDYNHDDYYGHSGSWPDIQDSLWLHHLDTPQVPFAVVLPSGGSALSDVPGIQCAATCTTLWDPGSSFTFVVTPPDGKRFIAWGSGPCSGPVSICSVTVDAPTTIAPVFGPATIAVRVAVTGKGRVACTPACSRTFRAGKPLTLRAVPAKGWRFLRWGGACAGTRTTCRPKTDFALSVRATFKKKI